MNLEEVLPGKEVVIEGFVGTKDLLNKVQAMGLRKGKKVKVLRKLGRNILLGLNNSRLVLSKDIARYIIVQ
ncbi:FeoA family protein [Thermocrinis minervae]|uniref:Ferrous iron transport protein A n=1 Tax=Thermocrinis minervae TaxID=381751 RepID=A0A1M6SE04_9AQUI|nr:FeoA family protein [Thermocrinis minervae]SHK42963.1 ferrous iron transport protein A [Thermocrinis minervae]